MGGLTVKTSEPATAATHHLMPVSKCSSNFEFLFLKTGLSLWEVIIVLLRTKYSTTESDIYCPWQIPCNTNMSGWACFGSSTSVFIKKWLDWRSSCFLPSFPYACFLSPGIPIGVMIAALLLSCYWETAHFPFFFSPVEMEQEDPW